LEFYSASSLKQQLAGRHVAPLGHISLIPNQPVFALSPYCWVLRGKAARNTNFIVFGLTTIYRTRGEHANHYATVAVQHTLRCAFDKLVVCAEKFAIPKLQNIQEINK
jgi:hypothetical protein